MKRLTIKTGIAVLLGLGFTMSLMGLLSGPGASLRAAPAAELHVCPSGCTYSSIQAAVDAASDDVVIKVATGTYTDLYQRPRMDITSTGTVTQVVYISKSITIQGGYTTTNWVDSYPITQPTTLDAQNRGRVFYITGEVTPTIEGLGITGGNAAGLGGSLSVVFTDSGGGIYGITATITLNNNHVFSNSGHFRESGVNGDRGSGGGAYFFNSPGATLNDNTFSTNTATIAGGLYFNASLTPTLTANTITNNTANHLGGSQKHNGGVFFKNSHNATLIDNIITANIASNNCAGVCFEDSNDAVLISNSIIGNVRKAGNVGRGIGLFFQFSKNGSSIDNVISNNTSEDINNPGTILGGGVYIGTSSTILMMGNTISANHATRGGGVYIGSNSSVEIISSIIAANIVHDYPDFDIVGYGGGLYLSNAATTTLTNTVVIDNRTSITGSGSALYIFNSSPHLIHTTIARNEGADGSGVYISGTASFVAMTNTILVSHSIGISVTSGNTAMLNGVLWYSNTMNTGGMGTITVTNEYTGDPAFDADGYHLTAGSAAINKGIDTGVVDDIDGDQRYPFFAPPDIGVDELIFHVYLPVIFGGGGGISGCPFGEVCIPPLPLLH